MDILNLYTTAVTYPHETLTSLPPWEDLSVALNHLASIETAPTRQQERVLPALCCAAVGGDPTCTTPANAAWRLFVLGAMLLDDAMDQDTPTVRAWAQWPWPRQITTATACYLTAQSYLAELALPLPLVQEVRAALLHATHAQAHPPQRDLSSQKYYAYIVAKSGLAFAIMARIGAALGTANPKHQQAAFDYGMALGLLRQLHNDTTGWKNKAYANSDFARGLFTLPLICAMGRTNHPQHAQLAQRLAAGITTEADYTELKSLVQATGALQDCAAVAELRIQGARAAAQTLPHPAHLLTLIDAQ